MFDIWCFVSVLTVLLLFPACRKCKRCRWFWYIQMFQLAEMFAVVLIGDRQLVYALLFPNMILGIASAYLLCCFNIGSLLLWSHFFLKDYIYVGLDAEWNISRPQYLQLYWLNNLIILVLLSYAVRNAIPRVKGALCQKTLSTP